MGSRETTAASIPVKLSFTSFKGTATTKAGRFWGANARGSLRNLTTCSCFDCRQVTKARCSALATNGSCSARKFPCDALGIDQLVLAKLQYLAVVEADGKRADQQECAQKEPKDSHAPGTHTSPTRFSIQRHLHYSF